MKKIYIILALMLTVLSAFSVWAKSEKGEISEAVLRLHIVANSNSYEDQKLKIKVRDAVLKEFQSIAKNTHNKKEAMEKAIAEKERIKAVSEEEIIKNGFSYPVAVNIEKSKFPTKVYNNVALPAGIYDAVNIKIGEGNGENWWCVMYPPLCLADSMSMKMDDCSISVLRENLSEEEFKIITDREDTKIKIKFKILELF